MQRRKLFLKRVQVDTIQMNDLFIGKTISILSRQLTVKKYCNQITKNKFETNQQIINILFNTKNSNNNIATIQSFINFVQYLENDSINNMFKISKLKSVIVQDVVIKELSQTFKLRINYQHILPSAHMYTCALCKCYIIKNIVSFCLMLIQHHF